MKISKVFTFDAAHKLPKDECYGKCSNLHGHTYKLIVTMEGPVNEKGWVINFSDLKKIVNKVVESVDHTYLNDVFSGIPTAENLIKELFDFISAELNLFNGDKDGADLTELTLYETPDSFVTYNG